MASAYVMKRLVPCQELMERVVSEEDTSLRSCSLPMQDVPLSTQIISGNSAPHTDSSSKGAKTVIGAATKDLLNNQVKHVN